MRFSYYFKFTTAHCLQHNTIKYEITSLLYQFIPNDWITGDNITSKTKPLKITLKFEENLIITQFHIWDVY